MTISKIESGLIIICLAIVMYLLYRQSFSPRSLISVAIGAAVALVCAFVVKKSSGVEGTDQGVM